MTCHTALVLLWRLICGFLDHLPSPMLESIDKNKERTKHIKKSSIKILRSLSHPPLNFLVSGFSCMLSEGERGPKTNREFGGQGAHAGGGGSGWDVSGDILYVYAFFRWA